MDEEIDEIPDRQSTKPDIPKPKKNDYKQTPIRLHLHDHALLMSLLKKDEISLQKFMGFCVRGYLDADPLMLKMLKAYRELEAVPKDIRDKHVLSNRERQSILDEIEKGTS